MIAQFVSLLVTAALALTLVFGLVLMIVALYAAILAVILFREAARAGLRLWRRFLAGSGPDVLATAAAPLTIVALFKVFA